MGYKLLVQFIAPINKLKLNKMKTNKILLNIATTIILILCFVFVIGMAIKQLYLPFVTFPICFFTFIIIMYLAISINDTELFI